MSEKKPRPDVRAMVTDRASKIWSDFKGFSPGQKAVTIVAVLAVLVGGYFLATWKATPTYAPLYSNLAASDASAIVSKLSSQGISYQLTDGGAGIAVPAGQVATARLAVSAAGLPASSQSGYSLLDKEGVTTSQFREQIDYQRAVEGELSNTIQAIQGVQAASVHLAIPQEDVYTDDTAHPTAAVLVTVGQGSRLTSSQVQTVVNLVSSSVTGMSASDVTVSDSNGNVLSSPGGGASGTVNADTQMAETTAYNNRVAAGIQAAVDSTLGSGHAKIVVNSDLDFSATKTNSSKYVYDPNTPPVSQSTSNESYGGAGASGSAAASSNTSLGIAGSAGASADGSGSGYSKTETTVNNALGTISTTTDTAPGGLKALHIAVVLDKNAKGLNVDATQALVKAGVGFDSARGDTLSVQAMNFDTSSQTDAAAAAKTAAAATAADRKHAQLVSLIKQVGFGLILAVLAFGTWRATRKRAKEQSALMPDETEYEQATYEEYPQAYTPQTNDPHHQRAELMQAADRRSAEMATVLSNWLAKER